MAIIKFSNENFCPWFTAGSGIGTNGRRSWYSAEAAELYVLEA